MVSRHTGLAGGYSAEIRVSEHRHFSIYAQANIIRGADGAVGYTVFLRHGRSDGSPIYGDAAWSFGRELFFRPVPRDRVCSGLQCRWNVGVLAFSRAEFAQLAGTGIELRLITSEGPIDLNIPARVFAEAAAQAAAIL